MTNLTFNTLLNGGGYSQTQLGVALASSTSLTDISAGGNTAGRAFTLPANYLQTGQQFRVRANGIVSNTATPTLLIGLYYGGIAGTALCTTGAATTVTSLSNNLWKLEVDVRVDGVGTSGALRSVGSITGPYAATTLLPATSSSGNSVTVDTSTAQIVTIGGQWGTSSASNSVQVCQFTVERLNDGF